MPTIKRTATSREMQKTIGIIKRMTFGMRFDDSMSKVNWKAVRRICDFGYRFMPKEKGVKFSGINLDGITAVMSVPENIQSEGIILYIHGGGFVSGSAKGTKGYCSMLAKASGCRVISIDYRLSPENKYPAALDDCFTAYKAIQNRYPKAKIAVTGESAGGNLCFALTVRCIERNVISPACVVAHSGGFDFTGSLPRDYEVNDYTVKPGAYEAAFRLYCTKPDVKNPEISPIYYDRLSLFPPVILTCDARETLKADSVEMYRKLENAGVEAILYEYENTFHAFGATGAKTPETEQLLYEVSQFMRSHID